MMPVAFMLRISGREEKETDLTAQNVHGDAETATEGISACKYPGLHHTELK